MDCYFKLSALSLINVFDAVVYVYSQTMKDFPLNEHASERTKPKTQEMTNYRRRPFFPQSSYSLTD